MSEARTHISYIDENAEASLTALLDALLKAEQGGYELDVPLEMAFFRAYDSFVALRENNAGTKIIVTRITPDGTRDEMTHWAQDYSIKVDQAIRLAVQEHPDLSLAMLTDLKGKSATASFMHGGIEVATATARTLPLAICAALVHIRLEIIRGIADEVA